MVIIFLSLESRIQIFELTAPQSVVAQVGPSHLGGGVHAWDESGLLKPALTHEASSTLFSCTPLLSTHNTILVWTPSQLHSPKGPTTYSKLK